MNTSCGDRRPPVHGVKPLHVRKEEIPRAQIPLTEGHKKIDVGRGRLRLKDEADAASSSWVLSLLAVALQGTAHAGEQVVRSERFYEIANYVGFDRLCPRTFVRIGGHENSGDRAIRGDQMLIELESGHFGHAHVRDQA